MKKKTNNSHRRGRSPQLGTNGDGKKGLPIPIRLFFSPHSSPRFTPFVGRNLSNRARDFDAGKEEKFRDRTRFFCEVANSIRRFGVVSSAGRKGESCEIVVNAGS